MLDRRADGSLYIASAAGAALNLAVEEDKQVSEILRFYVLEGVITHEESSEVAEFILGVRNIILK